MLLEQLTQTETNPLHDLNAHFNPPRNMKVTILHSNERTNINISDPDVTPEDCKENLQNTATLPSLHNVSVLEKKQTKTKSITPQPMTFIHQNEHYHVICV